MFVNEQGAYLFDEDTGKLLAGLYAGIAAGNFEFSGTIARFESADGNIGFIDKSGREVIPAIYTVLQDFPKETGGDG